VTTTIPIELPAAAPSPLQRSDTPHPARFLLHT